MKYIVIILFATIINSCSNIVYGQMSVPAPTDTLSWLKTNIEQQSSFFIGKPFSVLLDTLYAHRFSIFDYDRSYTSDNVPGYNYPPDTVWTNEIVIYFGAIYDGGTKSQMHTANWKVNTHIPYLTLTFTQKIPFVTTLANDIRIGTLFGPVQSLCRPFMVASVVADEW